MNNAKKGFTLIELLVVIAIIGILTTIVVASLNTARVKSRDTGRVQAVRQVRNALQVFFSTNGYFPAGDETTLAAALVPTYISSIGTPTGDTIKYQALSNPATGGACNSGTNCQSYHIGITLEGGANSGVLLADKDGQNVAGPTNGTTIDGVSTTANCGPDALATILTDLCYDIVP
jgi:prepilin-type N-terminal cleavage/methylation domain-containing protein